ncbi:MAG: hypothetical protein LBK83_01985 [Treponema sp.]|jgi:hypothetical protein|nr:hypothetical protein [Treponema sp.]
MEIISLVISASALVVALAATFIIPRKIMIDQRYSDLLQEYRSSEMGAAILSVCHFYVHDCKNDVGNIAAKYREKYIAQIEDKLTNGEPIDYAHTLHFQRRLIAQFYYDMAYLRYNLHCPRLSKKQLQDWFTPSEVDLLAIILHMAGPAREVFEEACCVPDPLKKDENDVPMNKLLCDLYRDSKRWVQSTSPAAISHKGRYYG